MDSLKANRKNSSRACKPGFVLAAGPLDIMASDSHSSGRFVAKPLKQPTRGPVGNRLPAYVVLHRVRFAEPPHVTAGAVGFYPTFEPLPYRSTVVYFLWHYL